MTLNIASVWRQSEFNVVGNAGGSRANFNSGSSVTVKICLAAVPPRRLPVWRAAGPRAKPIT